MIPFVLGLITGIVACFVWSCCIVAGRADEQAESLPTTLEAHQARRAALIEQSCASLIANDPRNR